MNKKILLFPLFFILVSSFIFGLNYTDTTDGVDCSSITGTTFFGISDESQNGEYLAYSQTVGYTTVFIVDKDCSIIAQKNYTGSTFFGGTGSLSHDYSAVDDTFIVGADIGGVDTFIVVDRNAEKIDSFTTAYAYDKLGTAQISTFIYMVSNSPSINVDRYTTNGIFVDRVNITDLLADYKTGIIANQYIKGITYLSDESYLLYTGSNYQNRLFQISLDSSSLLDVSSINAFGGSTNRLALYQKGTDTINVTLNGYSNGISKSNIDIYSINDLFELDYYVFGGQNYSKTLCIDQQTILEKDVETENGTYTVNYNGDTKSLCTDTKYNVDVNGNIVFYCDSISEITPCSLSCDNENLEGTISGVCSQLSCEQECNVEGQTVCTSTGTYATCGQFDNDACLELGNVEFCPANYYCSETEIGSQCSTVTSDLWSQDYIVSNVELTNQTGVVKEEGTSQKTKNIIETSINLVVPLFSSITTNIVSSFYKDQINETYVISGYKEDSSNAEYYAYDCNYNEEYLITDDLEHNDLISNGWIGSGTINNTQGYNFINTTSNINRTLLDNENSRILTTFEFEETGTYNIKVHKDTFQILDFEFINNKSSYNIYLIEKENSKTIFNSTSTTDDLQEINIDIKTDDSTQSATIEITLIRNVLGVDIQEKYFSLPISLSAIGTDKLEFGSNGNQLLIYDVTQSSVEDYPIYSQTDNTKTNVNCQHDQAECYIIRTYHNEFGINSYHFYDETQTCVESLGGVINNLVPEITNDERSTIEKILGKTFDKEEKLMFAVVVLVVLMLLFGALTYSTGDRTFLFIGVLLGGILLVAFILQGFIPAWVVILFGIVGALVSAQAIKQMSIGG